MTALLPPLVSPDALAAAIGHPSLRVFEATVHLTRPAGVSRYSLVSGRDDYEREHIPGAAFVDLPAVLSDPNAPLLNTLLDPERFARAAGTPGIGPGTHVVVYSRSTPMWATRLWWMLRHAGFDDVSVLDGGFHAWREAELPLERGSHEHPSTSFVTRSRPQLLALRGDVEAATRGMVAACLVNALSSPGFRGEDQGSAARAGRIPGSVNVPWQTLLVPESGRFQSLTDMEATLRQAGVLDAAQVIAYCGGGIAATVPLFALSLLGRADARLYDGSLGSGPETPSCSWRPDPSRNPWPSTLRIEAPAHLTQA